MKYMSSIFVFLNQINIINSKLSLENGFDWKILHSFLNVRKHYFPSTEFISYIKEFKYVTLILHF